MTLAQPVFGKELNIEAHGVEIDQERKRLLNEVMLQVFRLMGHSEGMPKALIIVDGEIRLSKDGESMERKKYLNEVVDEKHYSEDYPYEQRARSIQSQVLEWWFLEKEGLDFSFSFG